MKSGEIDEEVERSHAGSEEEVRRDVEVFGDEEGFETEEVHNQSTEVVLIGEGDEGVADMGGAEAEDLEAEDFVVGGDGGGVERDGDFGEVVEGDGGRGGGYGGDEGGDGGGLVWRGGDEDVDGERRLGGFDEIGELYHGDQVAHHRRREHYDGGTLHGVEI